MFDFQRFAAYGEKGCSTPFRFYECRAQWLYSVEREVGRNLEQIFQESRGKILVSTFSSSIPRIQQVVDISESCGRRVVLSGRSMIRNSQVAAELGYLRLPRSFMTENEPWHELPPKG